MSKLWEDTKSKIEQFLTWKWVERLFHWIITSGGTLSGVIFLIGGIWLSINQTVSDIVNNFNEHNLIGILTFASKTAFIGLPEIILFLASRQTIDLIKLSLVLGKKKESGRNIATLWAVLYGIPTLVFLSFALINIGMSLADANYKMPQIVEVGRGLTCAIFALIVYLYETQGKDCFAKYVEEKDLLISQVTEDKDSQIAMITSELDKVKADFTQEKQELIASFTLQIEELTLQLNYQNGEVKKLAEKASEASLQGLNQWDKSVINWIENADSTVGIDEITLQTGFTKRKIAGANLRSTGRNKERFYKDSVIDFLRKNKPNKSPIHIEIVEESNGNGHGNGHGNTDEIEAFSFPLLTVGNEN